MGEEHRILVVDDEPCIRQVVAALLSAQGYNVSTAEHGFDALLQIRSVNPELIVSDLNMPQMSGFELLSVLRRRFPEILDSHERSIRIRGLCPRRRDCRCLLRQGASPSSGARSHLSPPSLDLNCRETISSGKFEKVAVGPRALGRNFHFRFPAKKD